MIPILAAAWEDGVSTPEEPADLRIVGDFLGISQQSITPGLMGPIIGQDEQTGACSTVLAARGG